jgi:putative acyl-CoA dehydrogenase
MERTPNAAEVQRRELGDGKDARLKSFTDRLEKRLAARQRNDEAQARALVREMVLALQAALLIKHAPVAIADGFCASRLDGEGAGYQLPRGLDLRAIADARPRSTRA